MSRLSPRDAAPAHATARVNGVTLHVVLAGDVKARPLLLLHGFTGSAETWTPFLPAFTMHLRVIAVDLLGHGRSDAPEDPQRYRMERCVEDLLALLDCLGVAQAGVLGYSMGGRVALHLAAAACNPQWIRGSHQAPERRRRDLQMAR
ncbi:MAG: alpha/beta fold hydrolase [Anaerolineae bacterium]|nr:alpha/beta fold hydrolase [Anaerolineae bacterium]